MEKDKVCKHSTECYHQHIMRWYTKEVCDACVLGIAPPKHYPGDKCIDGWIAHVKALEHAAQIAVQLDGEAQGS